MVVNGIRTNVTNKHVRTAHFKIKKDVFEEMIACCQLELPYEESGLLSGIPASGDTLLKLKNESPSPNRFFMSVKAIKHAVHNMENKGEKSSDIFHSHPSSPAIPSSHEIENKPDIDLDYLIDEFYKEKIDVVCFWWTAKLQFHLNESLSM